MLEQAVGPERRPVLRGAGSPTSEVVRRTPTTARLEGALIRRSTDEVERRHRVDWWIDAVSEAAFPVTSLRPDTTDFHGELQVVRFDVLTSLRTSGSPRSTSKASSVGRDADDPQFLLLGTTGASIEIESRGHRIALAQGDLLLADTRHVLTGRHLTSASVLALPSSWARTWLRDPERLAGRPIHRDRGWGSALSSFFFQLAPALVASSSLSTRLLSDSLGSLLSLVESDVLGRPSTHPANDVPLCDVVVDTLRQRAIECGLTAEDVARSVGVSERTLHRCLASRRLTFSGLLLQFRIDCARRMLEAANFRRLTTAEIGRRSGFADASYFVRVATRHLGKTPRQYRLACPR